MPRSRPTDTRASERAPASERRPARADLRATPRAGAPLEVPQALGGLQLGARQLAEIASAPAAAASTALTALSRHVPATLFTRMKRRGVTSDSATFATEMAALGEQYSAELGHLTVNPRGLEQAAAIGAAAEAAIGPISSLLNVLTNIRHFSLATASKDGRLIYRRAVSVAETSAEVARAIAPYRGARIRAGKKAAATRRSRTGAHPAPSPAAAPGGGETTITTTTTTKK